MMRLDRILKVSSLALFISMTMASCSDENPYLEYTDRTSIEYSGSATPVKYQKGINKAKLFLKLTNDPSVNRVLIKWLEAGVDKELEVPIEKEDVGEIKEVLIENLSEGSFNFNITTHDDEENLHSVTKEIIIEVLGANFPDLLSPLKAEGAVQSNGDLSVTWERVGEDSFVISKRLTYTNEADEKVVRDVKKDELETIIKDYKAGTEVKFKTQYYDPSWIEPFFTKERVLAL